MTIYTIHAVSYKVVRYISSFHTQREGKFMNPAVRLHTIFPFQIVKSLNTNLKQTCLLDKCGLNKILFPL